MINLYLFSFQKRSNSTKQPSGDGLRVQAVLKADCSLYNPAFELRLENADDYNYIRWGNRYYYVNDVQFITSEHVIMSCNLDILATYRTNIKNTTAYVEYSASNYDDRIVDTRFSTVDEATYSYASSNLLTLTRNGTFVLSYNTSSPTYGASGCVWLSLTQAREIASILSSNGFEEWLTQHEKQLTGAYEALTNMKYIPLALWSSGGGSAIITLAGYATGIGGTAVDDNIVYSTAVSIPWQYSDFRNLPPYSSMLMWLPGVGFVDLNPSDYIGYTSINVSISIDGVTGSATYVVGTNAKFETNIAVNAAIGIISANPLQSMITAGFGAISGALLGGPAGAVTAASSLVTGAIQSQQRNVGMIGSNEGIAGIYAHPSFCGEGDVGIVVISHNTNQSPTSLANVQGLNCRKVLNLSGLTGFVQTRGASVAINGSEDQAQQINQMLDGGIYLE